MLCPLAVLRLALVLVDRVVDRATLPLADGSAGLLVHSLRPVRTVALTHGVAPLLGNVRQLVTVGRLTLGLVVLAALKEE